ncbi:MAG: hypothetical protein HPY83_02565 [Anaerolineae bacterium]|nr:hypothetical protein [Anaerolineae bacterium]
MDAIQPAQSAVPRAGLPTPPSPSSLPGWAEPMAPGWLTPEQAREVERLKQRDAEVRRHEQAHRAAGGPYVRAARYQYRVGPDGRRYAVSGEVEMDVAEVPDSPEGTIRKMQIVARAALAVADISPADRRVAAQARAIEALARRELHARALKAAASPVDVTT